MVNKYGYKMKGLKRVAGMTNGIPAGFRREIYYSEKYDEVCCSELLTNQSFCVMNDEEYKCVMIAGGKRTMQQIADSIYFYKREGYMKSTWM